MLGFIIDIGLMFAVLSILVPVVVVGAMLMREAFFRSRLHISAEKVPAEIPSYYRG